MSAAPGACPDCDLLYERPHLVNGQVAYCARCGAELDRDPGDFVSKTLACSLAGLLFYIPANTLPVLTLQILKMESTNNMLNGVHQLFIGGYWWMSFLVLMCSVVVPLLDLLLLFSISLGLKKPGFLPVRILKQLMIGQRYIQEWGMPEVYMLGILVAYIKMVDMGSILVGTGLFCFIGLLISIMMSKTAYRAETAFEWLERRQS